jgi:hypothetical protein
LLVPRHVGGVQGKLHPIAQRLGSPQQPRGFRDLRLGCVDPGDPIQGGLDMVLGIELTRQRQRLAYASVGLERTFQLCGSPCRLGA